jgi:hypothetical protein
MGHNPYAMVDSGAGPNLVRTSWLKEAWPDYKKKLISTGAATTRFKLADGGKSASPDGTIQLDLTINGAKISGKFWVLQQLTTNMIIGSKLLDELGAVINYGNRSIKSTARPDMGRIEFELKGVQNWRLNTAVTIRQDIVLLPNTVQW